MGLSGLYKLKANWSKYESILHCGKICRTIVQAIANSILICLFSNVFFPNWTLLVWQNIAFSTQIRQIGPDSVISSSMNVKKKHYCTSLCVKKSKSSRLLIPMFKELIGLCFFLSLLKLWGETWMVGTNVTKKIDQFFNNNLATEKNLSI